MPEALSAAESADAQVDCFAQIARAQELVATFGEPRATAFATARPPGLLSAEVANPQVVVGSGVGAELGRPGKASHSIVLPTARHDLVDDGRVRCFGPELGDCPPSAKQPLALLVFVSHEEQASPDPFALAAKAGLANRIPGLMTRLSSGRLWLRVSREALAAGLSLADVGLAAAWIFRTELEGVSRVEVVLVSGPEERVRSLDGIAAEALLLSGKHGKLVLGVDGVADCPDLDCESCEHKVTCDVLRDVAIRYRATQASLQRGRRGQ